MENSKFNLSQIARRIAHDSLRVRSRELIWIVCGKHNIAFAEDIAAEIALSGGYPIIEVQSTHVNKEVWLKAPPSYLARPRKNIARMKQMVDGIVWINPVKDPCIMSDVPFERLNLVSRAIESEFRVFEEMQLKRVLIEYPTPEQACFYGMEFEELFEMVWGGIEIEPGYFKRIGAPLKDILREKTQAHITTKKGSDLKFSFDHRKMILDTGTVDEEFYLVGDPYINLPAGEIFVPPLEDSAQGILVCDEIFLEGRKIFDLRLTFEDGKIVDFSAAEGEQAFREYFENLTTPGKIIAEFGIGLNPYITKVIGMTSTDEKAFGSVHVAIGSNTYFGGRNHADNHDDFVVQKPTLKIGDTLVLKEGKFTSPFNLEAYS
ncbi:MAG: aminopeptidase [Vulcanimicrobiota bacterium]